MTNFEMKILKQKKLDAELNLIVKQNEMSGRIFVEFSTENRKLVLQKSFQDTIDGSKDAERFAKSIKSMKDLRKYFGLKDPKPVVISEVVTISLPSGVKNGPFKRFRKN